MLAQFTANRQARIQGYSAVLTSLAGDLQGQNRMKIGERWPGNLDIRFIHKHTAIIAVLRGWRLSYWLDKDIFGRFNDKPCQLYP
jgi:hypothetical protein